MRKDTGHINYVDMGKRIQKKRKEARLTQQQIADCLDLDISTISKIETGKTKVSLSVLVSLANILCTSVDELLCGSVKSSETVYQDAIVRQLQQCSIDELRLLEGLIPCLLEQIRQNYTQIEM